MTLPPHHRQGFGTLMIEFSENSSDQTVWLNSCMSQAMNYQEEQVKLVHQSDRSQISVSAATFSFGYLTLSVSSGRGSVSYSLSTWHAQQVPVTDVFSLFFP